MKRRTLISAAVAFAPINISLAQSVDWQETTDVVVIGSGVGGLTAAICCAQKGLKVILLEKMSGLGGDSLRSGGYFAAVTQEAINRGEDSIELFKEHILTSANEYSDPSVVEVYAQRAGESFDWLKAQGIRFLEAPNYIYGGMWKRAYKPITPSGSGYIHVLSNRCLENGVDIRKSSEVVEILKDSLTGEVSGVVVKGNKSAYRIQAHKAVVIASGGFGADKNMVKEIAPYLSELGTDSQPGSTGGIIRAAQKIGAKTVNMHSIECVPGGDNAVPYQVRLDYDPKSVIFIDESGKRFVDESSQRSDISEAYFKKNIKRCYSVADSKAVESFGLMRKKNLYRGLYSKLSWRKDSLKELADTLNVNAENLAASVRDKETDNRKWVAPYWAVRVVFRIHSTLGGLAINKEARVLDRQNRPIPKLFATGEIVGNIHGKNRLGGNGLNLAVTFARVAAENI